MNNYFEEELLNTEIKHNILRKVLLKSLSIASASRFRLPYDMYSYIDLYAGEGIHNDGKLGSPLIALETIDSFKPYKYDFKTYKCFFTEMSDSSCIKLKNNLKIYQDKMIKKEIVDVVCEEGDWCIHKEKIVNQLLDTKWGFMFADPFANQINMNTFLKILNTRGIYSSKDIMIFLNYVAFKRIIGTGNEELIQDKVCDFFATSTEELFLELAQKKIDNINFELLNKLLISRLKETNKEFICGVSIPNTKKGSLTKSDYFFLLFCTTDINMADEFYKSYKNEMLRENNGIYLFSELESQIDEIVKTEVTLLVLYKALTSSFISWKNHNPEDVPTKKQIIDYLNKLTERGTIELKAIDESVFYKRFKKFKKLKISLGKRELEGIKIIYVR